MLNDLIKTKVLDYLFKRTGTNDWSFNNSGIASNESVVYRISSNTYSYDLALKVYNNKKTSMRRGSTQYAAIERFYLSNSASECIYRAPKPYGFFKEDGFYIMEWVSGDTLKNLLWKNCFFKGKLQKYIIEASRWVKRYHDQANIDVRPVDISYYTRSIELSITDVNAQEFTENNKVFYNGFDTLKNFSSQFAGYETLHADIHGDLNLGNFIITDKCVTGIDIGAASHFPVQNDLTQMLHHICVNYFLMLPRSAMRKKMSEWEILNVILDAYSYSDDIEARNFFLFVFFYQSLRRWVSIQDIHKKNKNHSIAFVILGKWRMYNASIIVDGLTKVINERYLA